MTRIPHLSRRRFLIATGACCATALTPTISLAYAPTDRRFVFVFLRGGMDGLCAVPPIGDPDYAAAKGALALGTGDGVLALGSSGFGLHPALAPLADLYQSRELAVFHAIASPYRERSHFDAQDTVENGTAIPHGRTDGWLNRALASLQGGGGSGLGLALGQIVPLIMQGDIPVDSWAPQHLPEATPDFLDRVHALYHADPDLDRAIAEMQASDAESAGMDADNGEKGAAALQMAAMAGRMLASANGPRIAVFDVPGWDTHVGQGKEKGRLASALGQLAGSLAAVRREMQPVWAQTVVLAVTEFGRTVAPNGTGGTDHGTATAAFLLGGSVAGGRVIADWPGLKSEQLYQNRDLKPTNDLRSVFKTVLEDHMRMSSATVESRIFLNSGDIQPMQGLFV